MTDKDKRFEFKLPEIELAKLHRVAKERGVSAASLLRRSIKRFKEHEQDKPAP
jgi:hypothetical protein